MGNAATYTQTYDKNQEAMLKLHLNLMDKGAQAIEQLDKKEIQDHPFCIQAAEVYVSGVDRQLRAIDPTSNTNQICTDYRQLFLKKVELIRKIQTVATCSLDLDFNNLDTIYLNVKAVLGWEEQYKSEVAVLINVYNTEFRQYFIVFNQLIEAIKAADTFNQLTELERKTDRLLNQYKDRCRLFSEKFIKTANKWIKYVNDAIEQARLRRANEATTGRVNPVVFTATRSSRRYKDEIEPMPNPTDKLQQLEPVLFKYLNKPEEQQYGLIAEDVQAVYPDLVYTNERGLIEGVHYHKLIPILLKEVQQLRLELNSLK